jgi:hypothetical protein
MGAQIHTENPGQEQQSVVCKAKTANNPYAFQFREQLSSSL